MKIAIVWLIEKIMCGCHVRVVTTKRMIISMIQVIDVTAEKRGETMGTKPSATPTL
jgi:hypothetical protein